MEPFRRRRGVYVAGFTADEAQVVRDLIDQLRVLLDRRREAAPTDPLAELTGISAGPADAPDDPALARLLPDFHADDAELSAGLRQLREPELLALKDDAAAVLLQTLPVQGGQVRLDAQQAEQWMRTLNDLRLVLAERLHLTDDPDSAESGAEPAVLHQDPTGHARALYQIYGWLSAVLDSLVTA